MDKHGNSRLYAKALLKADEPASRLSWRVVLPAKDEKIKKAAPQRPAQKLHATTRPARRAATTQTAGEGQMHTQPMAAAIYGAFNCGPLVLFAGARHRRRDYPCWRAGGDTIRRRPGSVGGLLPPGQKPHQKGRKQGSKIINY